MFIFDLFNAVNVCLLQEKILGPCGASLVFHTILDANTAGSAAFYALGAQTTGRFRD